MDSARLSEDRLAKIELSLERLFFCPSRYFGRWLFWDSFAGGTKGPSVFWGKDWGIIRSETYCAHILPLIHGWLTMHPSLQLMQDNAPGHVGSAIKEKMRAQGITPIVKSSGSLQEAHGMDELSWSNVATADTARLWGHLCCVICIVCYSCFVITRELNHFLRYLRRDASFDLFQVASRSPHGYTHQYARKRRTQSFFQENSGPSPTHRDSVRHKRLSCFCLRT
jgi:hypothetical protein